MRLAIGPAKKLAVAEQIVMVMVMAPTAANGWPMSARMAGQATPRMPSGSPKLMKDR